jgi:hypothetical protein
MKEVVFFLEELSAQVMLEGFLPNIISDSIRLRFIVFEGKQDLERQMVKRMRGYRVPDARFVVLRDKDFEDCRQVKKRLVEKCAEGRRPGSLVRVACHELESWYLGDLAAVEAGLGVTGLARQQHKTPYDKPDDLAAPAKKLQSIAPVYQKVGGSRAIGPHLNPDGNRSQSFGVFVAGMRKLAA